MHIIGGNEFDIQFTRNLDFFLYAQLLIVIDFGPLSGVVCRVAHDFQIIVFAQQVFIPLGSCFGSFYIAGHNFLVDFSSQTGGRNDQAFVMLFEKFLIDSGTIIIAVHKSCRT